MTGELLPLRTQARLREAERDAALRLVDRLKARVLFWRAFVAAAFLAGVGVGAGAVNILRDLG